jgi:hypothetical protein
LRDGMSRGRSSLGHSVDLPAHGSRCGPPTQAGAHGRTRCSPGLASCPRRYGASA